MAARSSQPANAGPVDPARGLLVDLHSHSRYSDGTATLEDIEAVCDRRRIGVALTDHNEIRGAIRLWERERIWSVPAIEVGTIEGLEFLVYFADPGRLEDYFIRSVDPHLLSRFMVRSRARSLAVIEGAQELGGYVSLAHPFAPGRKSIDFHRQKGPKHEVFVERVLHAVNAIERFNGGVLRRSNTLAEEFSIGVEKPFTAGSDSHHVSTLGTCGVLFDRETVPSQAALHAALATNGGLELVSVQGTHYRTVPIIALKHTLFFMQGRRAARRREH
jgi:predicted metal-dependent phosphoesterase TrpH